MHLKLQHFALGRFESWGGCQPAQRSVVMDLDAAAKAMGRDVVIAGKVEAVTRYLQRSTRFVGKD